MVKLSNIKKYFLIGLASFILIFVAVSATHSYIKNKNRKYFMVEIKKETVMNFVPAGTKLVSQSEHDGTKEPFELLRTEPNISSVTKVLEVENEQDKTAVIESFVKLANKTGWEELRGDPNNPQFQGPPGIDRYFFKKINKEDTQVWFEEVKDKLNQISVHAFAVNVYDD